MGYGKFEQVGKGLHLRQWARSYIIDDGNQILVFVNVDVGMIGDGLRLQVMVSTLDLIKIIIAMGKKKREKKTNWKKKDVVL